MLQPRKRMQKKWFSSTPKPAWDPASRGGPPPTARPTFSFGGLFSACNLQVRRHLRAGAHPGRVSRPSTLWYHGACSKPWDGGGPGLFPVSRKRTKMDGNDKGELLYRRRSSRMVLRVPLLINAVDSSGEASWEQVETVVVSLHEIGRAHV